MQEVRKNLPNLQGKVKLRLIPGKKKLDFCFVWEPASENAPVKVEAAAVTSGNVIALSGRAPNEVIDEWDDNFSPDWDDVG